MKRAFLPSFRLASDGFLPFFRLASGSASYSGSCPNADRVALPSSGRSPATGQEHTTPLPSGTSAESRTAKGTSAAKESKGG
ncbi:MAG TPA: hypothetical protein VFB12_16405 [Ktedonobacteraceae bacterium]|nr:hypothetical protein [Ktedonobacteraceae bacterium]